ncbi:MAG: aldo/keto reductase [Candidatus Marinimicrobia bacterium]|nr:aldo/keto reductase [Candidatus Neomarinimicrobiota bacterium]MCF7829598.1 aldo/keto reductase [Candidatus Neomarinimicrobiota bacterium]MCF7882252.1 aldo/keto reductase [Candidatus Neomarinimicrobiota bacterium]
MKHLEVKGVTIPALGFGTYLLRGTACTDSVLTALKLGYRHIDTAQMYRNESAVGKAVRESGIPRDQIFLTTKILASNLAPEDVLSSTHASQEKLDCEYIDLLLIHWPSATVPIDETIDAMNDLQEEGIVKHIGVSNFSVPEMEKAVDASETPILTNQVEYYPGRGQDAMLEYCQKNNLMLTAYSPLGKGRVIDDKTLDEIGARHNKTSAQVALRWLIQQENVVTIPKAGQESHIRDNFDIFDFELSAGEMETIQNL